MKIRTDFVTNSSSSSFVLVVRVALKNGEVLKFVGDSDGEAPSTYHGLTTKVMPKELGNKKSVDELIQALKASIVEERRGHALNPVLIDDDPLIKGLRKIKSMDEIETVTINIDAYGFDEEEYGYSHYTYYRDKQITVFDEGGDDIKPSPFAFVEGRDIIKADDFGECGDDGYKQGSDWDTPLPGEEEKTLKNDTGYFNIRDGVLIKYIGKDIHVVIPSGVKRIKENACSYTEMESVIIPEGVTHIDDCAFDSCTNLEEVTLPSSIEEIGEYAFDSCYSLRKIIGPARLEEVLEEAVDFEEYEAIDEDNGGDDESEDEDEE